MAHSPTERSGTPTHPLGLTLAFAGGRATVALEGRGLGGGVQLDHLELELAEVDVPLDLDGGPEVFQSRATQVTDLAISVDLRDLSGWLRAWAEALSLPADLTVVGEGGHLVLEGRWEPEESPFLSVIHVLRDDEAGACALRVVSEPVWPMGRLSRSVAGVFESLVRALEGVLASQGPRGLQAYARTGVRSLRVSVAEAVLWALFPAHGWKMPSLKALHLEHVAVEPERVRLSFGRGSRRPEPAAAKGAARDDAELPDDAELLVARGRYGDAVALLLGKKGPLGAATPVLDRVLELSWTEPELAATRRAAAEAAAARSPASVLAILSGAVFGGGGPAAFESTAHHLKGRGYRRAAARALQEAASRWQGRDPDQQLRLWEDAVALHPDDPQLLDRVVERLAEVGRTAAALRATRRLVRLQPDAAGPAWTRAAAWSLPEDPQAARRLYAQALAADPEAVEAGCALLRLDVEAGEMAQAETRLRAWLDRASDATASRALTTWSELTLAEGRPAEARSAITEALERDPAAPEAWPVAARVFEPAEWAGWVQRFSQWDPLNQARLSAPRRRALAQAAVAAFAQTAPELAEQAFRALKSDPDVEPERVADAGARLGLNVPDQAAAAVESATELVDAILWMERWLDMVSEPSEDPRLRQAVMRWADHAIGAPRRLRPSARPGPEPGGSAPSPPAELLWRLARVAARTGQNELEHRLLHALPPRPNAVPPEAAARWGLVQFESSRLEDALPWLERAISGPHPEPGVVRAWADALEAVGPMERAADALAQAAESAFDPAAQSELWGRLSWCLQRLGRAEEASTVLRKALAISPTSAGLRQQYLASAIQHGDFESGLKWGEPLLDNLSDLAPADRAAVASDLAKALQALGRTDEQVALLKRVLAVLEPSDPFRKALRTQLADALRQTSDRAALAGLRREEAESASGPERAALLLEAGRMALERQADTEALADFVAAAEAAEGIPSLRVRALDAQVELLDRRYDLWPQLKDAVLARWELEPAGLRERSILEAVDRWLSKGWVEGLDVLLGEACARFMDAVELPARLAQVLELQGRLREAAEAHGQAGRRADRHGLVDAAAQCAARAAELFMQVGDLPMGLHHDRTVVSLSRRPSEALARSLGRLEEAARESDAHEELVDWLERRVRLFPEDGWRAHFERGLVQAYGLGRWEEALDTLARAEVEAPRSGPVWAERSLILQRLGRHRERVEGELQRAERASLAFEKAAHGVRAAEILWNDLSEPGEALAQLEQALRIDPTSEAARGLRWSWLSESDAASRADALATEARLSEDPERAATLWRKAGMAYRDAAQADLGPEGPVPSASGPALRERAAAAFDQALRFRPQDKAVAMARVEVGPGPEALSALSVVERNAETTEERWACRAVRAAFKASLPQVPEETISTIERILELLPRLDPERFATHLAELGIAGPEDDLKAFLLDVGLEAAAARGDWRRQAAWLVARAEVTSDVHLRAELRLRAGHLLEWKLGDAAAAADEYRAALALSPEHPDARATLMRFFTDEQRFGDMADQLGLQALQRAWERLQRTRDRAALAAGEALFTRLGAKSMERAEVLLRLADLYRAFEDQRTNEVFALEEVVRDGPPAAQVAALERLDVLFDEAGRPDLRVDVLRKWVDHLDEPEVRAARLAELGQILGDELNDPVGAETEFKAALALDPGCVGAREGLFERLLSQERYAEILQALGPDGLRELRRSRMERGDLDGAFRAAEAGWRAQSEPSPEGWLELAERLDASDPRRDTAWARAAHAGSVEALDALRAGFRDGDSDRKRHLAELMAPLTSGAERADCLVVLAEADPDPDRRGLRLDEALRLNPDSEPARRAWILEKAERNDFAPIVERFGVGALEALVEDGPPQVQEAALAARAQLLRGAAAVEDHLRLVRMALARQDMDRAWEAMGAALRLGWNPAGLDPLWAELMSSPSATPPPMPAEVVTPLLDGLEPGTLTPERWQFLVQGVLRADGADGLARIAGGRPERQVAIRAALGPVMETLEPPQRVEALVALSRLDPGSPELPGWLDQALELAAEGSPEKLEALAIPWLESRDYGQDPEAQRAAIVRLRGLPVLAQMAELGMAALQNHLARGDLAAAWSEAELLFDSDLASPSLRRTAAESLLEAARDPRFAEDPERLAEAQDRAWVELARPETSEADDRRRALLELARLREARGAPAERVAAPLEVALGLCTPEAQLEVRKRLRELCEEAGDWSGAARHQAVVADRSQRAQDWIELAELRIWLDDPRGVQAALGAALRRDPKAPGLNALRIRWSEQQGEWDEAIQAWFDSAVDGPDPQRASRLLRAVELAAIHRTEQVEGWARLGLEQLGGTEDGVDFAEAVAERLPPDRRSAFWLEALRRLPPGSKAAEHRVRLARELAEDSNFEAAWELLEPEWAAVQTPEHPVLDAASSLPAEPERLLQVAEKVGPRARIRPLTALLELGFPSELDPRVRPMALSAIEHMGGNPSPWSDRFRAAVAPLDGSLAEVLREALDERDRGRDPVRRLLERGRELLTEGQTESALAVLEEAESIDATQPELVDLLFQVRVASGRLSEADAMLERQPTLSPDWLRRRGELLRERLDDPVRGAGCLQAAFEADPDVVGGDQAADALNEAGLFEQAEEVAERLRSEATGQEDLLWAEMRKAEAVAGTHDFARAAQTLTVRPGNEAQLLARARYMLEIRQVSEAALALGEEASDETATSVWERQRVRWELWPDPRQIPNILDRLRQMPFDAVAPDEAIEWILTWDAKSASEAASLAGKSVVWRLRFASDDPASVQECIQASEHLDLSLDDLERLAAAAAAAAEASGDRTAAFKFRQRSLDAATHTMEETRRTRSRRAARLAVAAFAAHEDREGLRALQLARWLDPDLDLSGFREPLERGPDGPEKAELWSGLAEQSSPAEAARWLDAAAECWHSLGRLDRALDLRAQAFRRHPTKDPTELLRQLEDAGETAILRWTLRAAMDGDRLPMAARMGAARRLVELEERAGRNSEALAVAQRALSIRAPETDLDLLEASVRTARRAGLVDVEIDALARLVRLADPARQQRLLRRRAALLHERDPDQALRCLEEINEPSRSVVEWRARLARRRGPEAEAELWARLAGRGSSTRKGAAFSRVAVLRAQSGDRRGARAAWRAAVLACPDDLAFRRGLMEQYAALGEVAEARKEALAAYRKAHDLGRYEAAFAFLFQGLRHTMGLGLTESEWSEWQEALELGVEEELLLNAMVWRARDGTEKAEALAELLLESAERQGPGLRRARLRRARARILRNPLGRPEEAQGLEAQIRQEDLPEGAAMPMPEPEPLETAEIGMPFSSLELASAEQLAWGEAQARATEDPVLRGQVWCEVARVHQSRRPAHVAQALEALDEALAADPISVRAWTERANLLMAQEAWSQVLECLNRVERLGGPPWMAAELELRAARAALAAGQREWAARWLDAAERRDPDNLAICRGRLAAERDRGQAVDALLSRLDPELDVQEIFRLRLERARMDLDQGDVDAALASLEELEALGEETEAWRLLRRDVLDAAEVPEPVRWWARHEADPQDPKPLQALLQHGSLSAEETETCIERLGRLDDPDGLRAVFEALRQRGHVDRMIPIWDRLGKPLPEAAEPAEIAAWVRGLAEAGRGPDALRVLTCAASREQLEAVLADLSGGQPEEARFWLQPFFDLGRDQLQDPQLRASLEVLSERFRDGRLEEALAHAEKAQKQRDAAAARYETLLLKDPTDLRKLEGLAHVRSDARRSEVETIRSYIRTGVGTFEGSPPDWDTWMVPLVTQVLGPEVAASMTGRWEGRSDAGEGGPVRDREAFTFLTGPGGQPIPVVRGRQGGFPVQVHLGPSPFVRVGWLARNWVELETLRFEAHRALAQQLLGPDAKDTPWADLWALASVRDLRAAVDACLGWGPGRLLEPPQDPLARTDALKRPRLSGLLKAVLTQGLS